MTTDPDDWNYIVKKDGSIESVTQEELLAVEEWLEDYRAKKKAKPSLACKITMKREAIISETATIEVDSIEEAKGRSSKYGFQTLEGISWSPQETIAVYDNVMGYVLEFSNGTTLVWDQDLGWSDITNQDSEED